MMMRRHDDDDEEEEEDVFSHRCLKSAEHAQWYNPIVKVFGLDHHIVCINQFLIWRSFWFKFSIKHQFWKRFFWHLKQRFGFFKLRTAITILYNLSSQWILTEDCIRHHRSIFLFLIFFCLFVSLHFIIFIVYIFYVPSPWITGSGGQWKTIWVSCLNGATNGLLTTYEFDKAQLGWTAGAGGLKIKIVECYHCLYTTC